MQTNVALYVCVVAGFALQGCIDPKGSEIEDPSGASETDDPSATSGVDSDPSTSSGTEDGTEPEEDSGVDTAMIFLPPDGGMIEFECDVWGQDCPEGHKCMPWDNMSTGSWNATKCTPIDPNPAQPGDDCVVEGTGVSGVDNCELASMCWAVDPETNAGTCVAFCSGTEGNPTCDDPSTSCSITNGGALILCLPTCDPLEQTCGDGQACYGVGNSFSCVPNAAGPDGGTYGDPCMYVNVCNPGLFCAAAAGVPGCQGSEGCCSEFCDLSSSEGAAQCQGAAGGQTCVAWFEENQAPPNLEDVGACVIPD